ncbi:MAG TPA: hypothetical protein VMX13_17390 [Sedimentisphaerales bacterium]|nr:hypothetical protein [Sedimentisphaerales bacterium]
MNTANNKYAFAIVLLCVLLGSIRYCLGSQGVHIYVTGLRSSGGIYQTVNISGTDYYIADQGALVDYATSDPNDDVEWYNDDTWCEECDSGDHIPGFSSICPAHAHIVRSSFPTSASGTLEPISQDECEEYWKAICLNSGTKDGKQLALYLPSFPGYLYPMAAKTDNEDDNDEYGSADLGYNCHGYAFSEDGLARPGTVVFRLECGCGCCGGFGGIAL